MDIKSDLVSISASRTPDSKVGTALMIISENLMHQCRQVVRLRHVLASDKEIIFSPRESF